MDVIGMYKTILAPLDGSKRAEAILPHLEQLGRRYNAKVIFLQAIERSMLFVRPETVLIEQKQHEEHIKETKIYLDGLKGQFRKKGIEACAFIVHSPVVAAIIEAAERENADLIALTSHGRTGLSKVFYGSVAAGVLNRMDRPLLLIRSD
jgi:nucleotide-binding universal stress UspA family protein